MQTTSQPAASNCSTLDPHIDKAAALKIEIKQKEAELEVYLEGIKSGLKAAKLDRYVTPAGNEALLSSRTVRTWLVEKLKDVLDRTRFNLLCPRTPQARDLGKILEADPVLGGQLLKKGCFKEAQQDVLSVRPAAKDSDGETGGRGDGEKGVHLDNMQGPGRSGTTWPKAGKNGD